MKPIDPPSTLYILQHSHQRCEQTITNSRASDEDLTDDEDEGINFDVVYIFG
jgi:hypothetical protein